jgi:menaquinone-dependent protoporphyrinogen oxidase
MRLRSPEEIMSKVLLVYGTTEGHTAKIAAHIAELGRSAGHEVQVLHADVRDPLLDPAAFDGVLVGASVHEGQHQRSVRRWIRTHRETLARVPSAFFQVSLTSAIRDAEHDQQAMEVVEGMTAKTGWKPASVGLFAGAMLYTQYSWMKRFLMKQIAKSQGGDTDTTRDFEYTDWAEVDLWARAFFSSLETRTTATLSAGGAS